MHTPRGRWRGRSARRRCESSVSRACVRLYAQSTLVIEQRNGERARAGGPAGGAALLGIGLGLLILPSVVRPAELSSPGLWSAVASAAFGSLVGAGAWAFRGWRAFVASSCAALAGPIALAADPALMSELEVPLGASGALGGLALAGAALGAWAARLGFSALTLSVWLVLLALLGHGAALGWGVMDASPAFGPRLTARLLDLSPHGFVLECGGVDWMRSSVLYEGAGTDRIGPGLRSSWSGSVAAPLLVLVGCAGLWAARLRR